MEWLDGYYENKATARLVIWDGANFRDSAGNAISVSGSGESNTASNVGAGGVGVFNDKVGVDLQFRNIIEGSSKITVTLDDPNDEIEIDVAEANLSLNNMGGTIDLGGAQVSGTIAAARMPAHTGDATSSAGSLSLTIPNNTVTNAKAADMAANTLKANATGSSADPSDLSVSASRVVGRGPTGNITGLTVGAGLVISDTAIGTAAVTGDVSIGADGTTSVIGAGKVLTAMIGANQVSNAKLGQMSANTIKANTTGSVADCQNATITGGLSFNSGAPGSLESKGGFSFPCTFSTATTMDDPGADGVKFNSGTLASVTQFCISASLGGRDIGSLLDTLGSSQIGFMSNNSVSAASYAVFDVTAVDDNGTGEFYTFTGAPISGVGTLPSNGEKLQMVYWPTGSSGFGSQDVLDMLVVRTDAETGQLIDSTGNVISGSPSVADYTALVALDAADYDGFAVNLQSGHNNGFMASNGTGWSPLNGQLVLSRSTVPGNKVIFPDNVTWTAANNGSGKVRLTSSAAHGMTEANAEGNYLYLISGGTGWTAATYHRITPSTGFIDATHVDLDTNYTASMGVPVFAKAGTTEALSEAPLLTVSLPILRANTEIEIVFNIEYSVDASTNARRTLCYIGSTVLNNNNVTATNTVIVPYRMGFTNQNATNSQRSLVGSNTTGYGNNTGAPLTAAVDTSVDGAVLTIRNMPNVVGITACVGSYKIFMRG